MPSRHPSGGRPPRHCSASRQRTYELRRAQAEITIPLLERDIDDMRTKAGIERAVIAAQMWRAAARTTTTNKTVADH